MPLVVVGFLPIVIESNIKCRGEVGIMVVFLLTRLVFLLLFFRFLSFWNKFSCLDLPLLLFF